jgi:hypothetical protein
MDALLPCFSLPTTIFNESEPRSNVSEYRLRERDRSCGALAPAECHCSHPVTTVVLAWV